MSFEDKFPGIHNAKIKEAKEFPENTTGWAFTYPEYKLIFYPITTDDIEKHCLDKQKVKKTIERLQEEDRSFMMGLIDKDDLFKELGLE